MGTKTMKKNKEAARPTGLHSQKLDQKYMKQQREIEENHLAQQPLWLLHNTYFC